MDSKKSEMAGFDTWTPALPAGKLELDIVMVDRPLSPVALEDDEELPAGPIEGAGSGVF